MKSAAFIRNIILVLLISSVIFYLLMSRVALDYLLVFIGNALLAGITLLSFMLATRRSHTTTHGFMNSIYSGTLVRLFLIAGAAAVYIYMVGGRVDARSLGLLGAMYIVYTAIETAAMQRFSSQASQKPQP